MYDMCSVVVASDNIPQKEQAYNTFAPCCAIFVASHNFEINEYIHTFHMCLKSTKHIWSKYSCSRVFVYTLKNHILITHCAILEGQQVVTLNEKHYCAIVAFYLVCTTQHDTSIEIL